ncbi:MAG: tetratricopeptide repeat protein [Streptosporangiaceae bacterium]
MLLRQQAELDAAIHVLERSLTIWRDRGDRAQEARELNTLAITHRHLGNLDTARSLFEQSIAITRELGAPPASRYGSPTWEIWRSKPAIWSAPRKHCGERSRSTERRVTR